MLLSVFNLHLCLTFYLGEKEAKHYRITLIYIFFKGIRIKMSANDFFSMELGYF